MAIESWIDELARVWGTIRSARRGNVRSYAVFEREEFPEAITTFPAAISYVTGVRFAGGGDSSPHILHWAGQTEFYLAEGTSKQGVPETMRYFERILRAALLARTLNGKVAEFALIKAAEGEAITGPAILNYGGEQLHLGLVVHWRVKEAMASVILGEAAAENELAISDDEAGARAFLELEEGGALAQE